MIIALIREASKENRIFRGELIEKVELCHGMCRLLLKDEIGDLIYCLLQGMHWYENFREISVGNKVILAPSKILEVPRKYKNFYAPEIKGKNISNLFFHFNAHDFDLEIYPDPSLPKPPIGLESINEIIQKTEFSIGNFNITAVIIDFYMKTYENEKKTENYYRLKLIDNSIHEKSYLNLNLYIKKTHPLKKVSIGDIIFAQKVQFRKKGNMVYGIHNKSSGSFATFSWTNCKLQYCSENFTFSEEIMSNICKLQNWIFGFLQHTSISCISTNLSTLCLSTSIDMVLYLVKILYDFPDAGHSTLIFSDLTNFAYMTVLSSLIFHIQCDNWIKLNQVRSQKNRIDMTEYSSFVKLPFWSPLVKSLPVPTGDIIKQALCGFSKLIGQNSCANITTKHSQEQFIDLPQLLNPSSPIVFARLKAIIIEFHPRKVGLGVIKTPSGRLGYSGLIKIWLNSSIFSVLVHGKNSSTFYGLNEYDHYSTIVRKVTAIQEDLCKSYGWAELGIKRTINDGKVLLSLSETEIKSYN